MGIKRFPRKAFKDTMTLETSQDQASWQDVDQGIQKAGTSTNVGTEAGQHSGKTCKPPRRKRQEGG